MSFFEKYLNYSKTGTPKIAEVVVKKIPWIEKYRPKTISEVTSQSETIATLENAIQGRNMPHLLFYGPPGTGKTSTILAICKQLYKSEYKNYVLELNASDERGINVVRGKVKSFAQGKTTVRDDIPPYKVLILDEIENFTKDGQAALRRMIEDYSKVTRFCLICNNLNRVIEPLASRCAKFRFKPLSKIDMKKRLQEISLAENLEWSEGLGDLLYQISHGDLRRAINLLQSIQQDFGTVTLELVKEIAGLVDNTVIQKLIDAIYENNFTRLKEEIDNVIAEGYTGTQIIDQFMQWIIDEPDLNDAEKAGLSQKMAETDKSLAEGSNESLQLYDLFGYCMKIISNYE